jgi:hypothetical protein
MCNTEKNCLEFNRICLSPNDSMIISVFETFINENCNSEKVFYHVYTSKIFRLLESSILEHFHLITFKCMNFQKLCKQLEKGQSPLQGCRSFLSHAPIFKIF